MTSRNSIPKTKSEIRSRITQIRNQRLTALTSSSQNFKSGSDPALAEYCLRLQLRLYELHWALGEKPKCNA
jgi:hypothetical protein